MMLLAVAVFLCSNFPFLAYSDDNLELLSTSLRRLEKTACEQLSISCPQGTSISLLSAKYSQGMLCPGSTEACQLPASLQYSLLQTAVERCQKKRHCRLQPSTNGFTTDPCPGVAKHMQIVYNCRPYEFRSKTACENEVVQLQCGPNARIAIYSASYGRTQYESVQCPQTQGVPEETCLAGYATETVIQFCHGKRRCALSVDSGTFGSPCRKESRMYLKVVYTCVPRQVLQARIEQLQELDEPLEPSEDWLDYEEEGQAAPNTSGHHNSSTASNESITLHHNRGDLMSTYPPNEDDKSSGKVRRDTSKLSLQPLNCTTEGSQALGIGFISQWMSVYLFLSNNIERLVLYSAVSVGGGLLCLLALVAARLAWVRRKLPAPPSVPSYTGEMFEGDVDLTIATPLPTEPSEVVRYPASVPPRSLSAANSQYYFG
ncbi:protein eva-1 homolog C isoform X2 [Halyomorpha halys]|uniref:protein eva-1 homolog C isoform X2 n=1 Tax=Halyomorpha halys TaxID=286706 RepID=UPI0006D501F1|nr:protein eva-1 homolog C-like isoform X1 [Halyomorpha halys]